MTYEYACENCRKVFEKDYKIGEAPKQVKCSCGTKCERHFGNMNFILQGSGWPSRTMRQKTDMTKRNERAGSRMKDNHESPKTVAHDYGNGDIREV